MDRESRLDRVIVNVVIVPRSERVDSFCFHVNCKSSSLRTEC